MTLQTDIEIIEQLIPIILKYGKPLLDEIKAMVEANRDPSKITTDMINQAFDKATQAQQQLNEALQG